MNNEHIRKISEAITIVEGRPTPYMWETIPQIGSKPPRYNWAWEIDARRYFSIGCEVGDTTIAHGRRHIYIPPQGVTLIWEGVAVPLQITEGHEVSFEDRELHRDLTRPIIGLGVLLRSAIEVPLSL